MKNNLEIVVVLLKHLLSTDSSKDPSAGPGNLHKGMMVIRTPSHSGRQQWGHPMAVPTVNKQSNARTPANGAQLEDKSA